MLVFLHLGLVAMGARRRSAGSIGARRRSAGSSADSGCATCALPEQCDTPLRWWHLGARSKYHDGNEQPICRGWIHGIGTLAAAFLMFSMVMVGVPGALVWMVACKGVVYAASASFHLVCWPTGFHERMALIADVSLVPLAILGGILPISDAGGLGVTTDCMLGAAVLALNVLLVAIQFRRGYKHLPGNSMPRSLVCVAYYVYIEIVAGRALGFDSSLWWLTPFLYGSAFLCAAGVDHFRERCTEPLVFAHHRRGVWTLHEDFHALLLISDVFSGWLGWGVVVRA